MLHDGGIVGADGAVERRGQDAEGSVVAGEIRDVIIETVKVLHHLKNGARDRMVSPPIVIVVSTYQKVACKRSRRQQHKPNRDVDRVHGGGEKTGGKDDEEKV